MIKIVRTPEELAELEEELGRYIAGPTVQVRRNLPIQDSIKELNESIELIREDIECFQRMWHLLDLNYMMWEDRHELFEHYDSIMTKFFSLYGFAIHMKYKLLEKEGEQNATKD